MEFLYVSQVTAGSGYKMDYIRIISESSPISKIILLLLFLFSVISWAVIAFKFIEYSKAWKNSVKFRDLFRKSRNFSDINRRVAEFANTPLATVFAFGFRELSVQKSEEGAVREVNVESVRRALTRGSMGEITRLEKLNGFLATTAAVTPFIGLLGTVWGIITSFHSIGAMGNANLATVAPGIAEALIATALGLFAAIPAVIFYNTLLNKLKVIISSMDDFILEFIDISEKLR